MIIDFDEILQKKRKRKEPVPLTSDWTITGWDNFNALSFSPIDPKANGENGFFNFSSQISIFNTTDFFALLDPRDEIIAGFPTEDACWGCATKMIGIDSITVMKKHGWRIVKSMNNIEK